MNRWHTLYRDIGPEQSGSFVMFLYLVHTDHTVLPSVVMSFAEYIVS